MEFEKEKKYFENIIKANQSNGNENSSSTQPTEEDYLNVLARNYGSLSWNYLLVKDYKQAEQSALKALELDQTQTWVKTNHAHALLFQNRFSKAEKIYKELSPLTRNGNETYKQLLLDDFDTLEKAVVIPEKCKADVEKIRKMLRE